ncbi:MAG: hypothetical protein R2941_18455 [Desulfobacterales bacterium]
MNIHAAIIDQLLISVTEAVRQHAAEELGITDADNPNPWPLCVCASKPC